jgi:GxxExxY protein
MKNDEDDSDGMAELADGPEARDRRATSSLAAGFIPRFSATHDLNRVVAEVVDASFQIHTDLGPGLLESTYERILERALQRRGIEVRRQQYCDFVYDGLLFRRALRLDLLVEDSIVVELKAERALQRAHQRQVVSYLRLLNLRLGLLINFGAPRLKQGFRRIINPDLW